MVVSRALLTLVNGGRRWVNALTLCRPPAMLTHDVGTTVLVMGDAALAPPRLGQREGMRDSRVRQLAGCASNREGEP